MEKRHNVTKVEKYEKDMKKQKIYSVINGFLAGGCASATVYELTNFANTDIQNIMYLIGMVTGAVSGIELGNTISSTSETVYLENKIEEFKANNSEVDIYGTLSFQKYIAAFHSIMTGLFGSLSALNLSKLLNLDLDQTVSFLSNIDDQKFLYLLGIAFGGASGIEFSNTAYYISSIKSLENRIEELENNQLEEDNNEQTKTR